jgi:hypothetical protein
MLERRLTSGMSHHLNYTSEELPLVMPSEISACKDTLRSKMSGSFRSERASSGIFMNPAVLQSLKNLSIFLVQFRSRITVRKKKPLQEIFESWINRFSNALVSETVTELVS